MKIYLVGGAVRDQLLGLPMKERDWVVVGATEEEMLQQDFIKVGKDFPVFLHPRTKEEYALARTERKMGKGYYGFTCYAAPDVTLEQDLLRRDLTINAIATDLETGKIIDPYHGQRDIQNKTLRHVSPAFCEDPVRILRVARFAARFSTLGFTVAYETLALMQEMVDQGEIDELVAERVWQEWQRSLQEKNPEMFLKTLNDCGALEKLFPPLAENFPTVLIRLHHTAAHSTDPIIRFAATMLDVNPALTDALFNRYRIPHEYRELATLVQNNYADILSSDDIPAEKLLKLLTRLDAWRRSERFQQVLNTCLAITSEAEKGVLQLKEAYKITEAVKPAELIQQGFKGAEIQAALQEKRLEALKHHNRNVG